MSDSIKLVQPLVPNATVEEVELLNTLADMKFESLGVGAFKEIAIEFNVKAAIQESLQKLNRICHGCSGDHNVWVVAGGYATHKVGHTTSYSDVDVFVCCNGEMMYEFAPNDYPGNNVLDFFFHNVKVQVIQVFFDCKLRFNVGCSFFEMMSLYVLSRFDIPLCRVAIRFSLDAVEEAQVYVIDLSAVESYKATNLSRLTKYQERKVVNDKKLVPSLKTIAARAFFK